jgi:hypothetical protein
LPDLAFDGESLWSFLLLPEACGLVVFCYGLYGCFWLGNRLLDWAAELAWKRQRSPWEEPSPNLFQRCTAPARKVCSGFAALHRSAARRIATQTAAPSTNKDRAEPFAKPQSFAFALFGVYNGAGEGYLWSEKDEIE